MKCRSESIDDLSDLLVRVITIGYEKKGESIIVILKDRKKDRIIYSIVIDSFKRYGEHRTMELLEQNNVGYLNVLCWTHPDSDHSRGLMEILTEHCCETTRIVTPICFWSKDYNVKAFSPNKREVDFLDGVTQFNTERKCKHHPVAVGEGEYACLDELDIESEAETIRFKVMILSPFENQLKTTIDRYLYDSEKYPEPKRNQTSVSLLLKIGQYNMLFAADIPNAEIELMNEEQIGKPVFIKIPHHGSDSSQKLLDYIDPASNTLACSTVYKSTKPGSSLPHKHVIQAYSELCDIVCCTGSDSAFNSSVITADYDFWGKEDCEIYLDGSSYVVR